MNAQLIIRDAASQKYCAKKEKEEKRIAFWRKD